MYGGKKKHIMSRGFVIATTSKNRRRPSVFLLLNIAERRLPETFRLIVPRHGLERMVACEKVPVSGFRPPFSVVMSIAELP